MSPLVGAGASICIDAAVLAPTALPLRMLGIDERPVIFSRQAERWPFVGAAAGFVLGVTAGTFDPGGDVTREQLATFVVNVLDRLVDDDLADPPLLQQLVPGAGTTTD